MSEAITALRRLRQEKPERPLRVSDLLAVLTKLSPETWVRISDGSGTTDLVPEMIFVDGREVEFDIVGSPQRWK